MDAHRLGKSHIALTRLGAILVVIATVARIAATYNVFSETTDEPIHVSSGLQIYEQHRYDFQTASPPLPRLFLAAGPWLLGVRLPPQMPLPGMMKMFYSGGKYPASLIAARAGNLVFVLIALAAAWAWARREAGELAAFLTVLLLAGEPLFLGHGGLATHDIAATAGLAVSLLAFSRWLELPRAKNAALLGAAYGFAVLCKFSCIVFLPIACMAILLVRRQQPSLRAVATTLAIVCGVSALVIWAGYGFSVGTVLPTGFVHEIIGRSPLLSWRIPAPRFVDGIAFLRRFDRNGTLSYFHGHISSGGWWYYFPAAVALKTTLPLLAMAMAGLFVARRTPAMQGLAAAGVILLVTLSSSLDIGARYVLPLYVPLAFAGAVTATTLLDRSRPVRIAAIVLLAAHVAMSALAHPDYIAYFNAIAGNNPSKWLIDSNLEWGQDAKRLAAVTRELQVDRLGHSIVSIADFDALGLPPMNRIDPGAERHGWLAIGEHHYRIREVELGGRLWLDGRPYRRVGKSIRLYHIP